MAQDTSINGIENIRDIFNVLDKEEKEKVDRYSMLLIRKSLIDKWIGEITEVLDGEIDYNEILRSFTGKDTKPAKSDIQWITIVMIQWKEEVEKELKEIEKEVFETVSFACCMDWLGGVHKRIVPIYADKIDRELLEKVLNGLNIPYNEGTKHMYMDVCKGYIQSLIASSKEIDEKVFQNKEEDSENNKSEET